MKLTVVGCSPAWPNAGGAHSGYLVSSNGRRLLLDCGPGVLARLRELEAWPTVDAIVISHLHLDHCGDLVPWLWGHVLGPAQGIPGPQLYVPATGLARISAFAPLSGALGARLVTAPDAAALGPKLATALKGDEIVLLKASRGVALERVLPFLTGRPRD